MGPLTTLVPGKSVSLTYGWYAGTSGVNYEGFDQIINCSNVECVVRPFSVSTGGVMSGHFGRFF